MTVKRTGSCELLKVGHYRGNVGYHGNHNSCNSDEGNAATNYQVPLVLYIGTSVLVATLRAKYTWLQYIDGYNAEATVYSIRYLGFQQGNL